MADGPKFFAASPQAFLRSAVSAVPAVRYAVGIGGIAAVVAIIAGFQIDLRIALFGTIIILGLMFVLLVFARIASVAGAALLLPALFATWAFLLLVVAASFFLLTGYFFHWPRSIESYVEPPPVYVEPDPPTPTPTPIPTTRKIAGFVYYEELGLQPTRHGVFKAPGQAQAKPFGEVQAGDVLKATRAFNLRAEAGGTSEILEKGAGGSCVKVKARAKAVTPTEADSGGWLAVERIACPEHTAPT